MLAVRAMMLIAKKEVVISKEILQSLQKGKENGKEASRKREM